MCALPSVLSGFAFVFLLLAYGSADAGGLDRLRNAELTEEFEGTGVEKTGAWMFVEVPLPVDHEARDPLLIEESGRRQPDRAGSDHENVHRIPRQFPHRPILRPVRLAKSRPDGSRR